MNEKEFARYYNTFADAIFRHCYFRLSDREKAKELVQESFMRTWVYLAEGNKIKSLKAFLYRVANNLVIDELRKKQVYSLDELKEDKGYEPSYEQEKSLQNRVEARHIIKALENLNQPSRDALIMRYIDDLKPKEIAELTGETEDTVSVRIHRAKKYLQEILKNKEDYV